MNALKQPDRFQIHLSTCVAVLMALNLAIFVNVQAIGGMLGVGFDKSPWLMSFLCFLLVAGSLSGVVYTGVWLERWIRFRTSEQVRLSADLGVTAGETLKRLGEVRAELGLRPPSAEASAEAKPSAAAGEAAAHTLPFVHGRMRKRTVVVLALLGAALVALNVSGRTRMVLRRGGDGGGGSGEGSEVAPRKAEAGWVYQLGAREQRWEIGLPLPVVRHAQWEDRRVTKLPGDPAEAEAYLFGTLAEEPLKPSAAEWAGFSAGALMLDLTLLVVLLMLAAVACERAWARRGVQG